LLAFVSGYEGKEYRPTNVNFGLFPAVDGPRLRGRERYEKIVQRAEVAFERWMEGRPVPLGAS
jgi:folate-dependent tRNA-U54 methylase TrmFO/GidA